MRRLLLLVIMLSVFSVLSVGAQNPTDQELINQVLKSRQEFKKKC